LPEHIEGPVFDAPAGAATTPSSRHIIARLPRRVGTGPYRLASYQSGTMIVLERNPAWKGKQPYFPAHHRQAIENTAALQANLLSGDIDMAPGDAPALTLDQVLQLRRQQPTGYLHLQAH